MKLKLYQIDAFATRSFEGNPAAVCPLDDWLEDGLMQSIAAENNLSETAFFVKTRQGYHIRWFTPVDEVDLCGHATLASAYVIFHIIGYPEKEILFKSKSGLLKVHKEDDLICMDFPSQPARECPIPDQIREAFEQAPIACAKSEDYIVIFEDENSIINADPDMSKLSELDLRGVAITSRSKDYDFVTRFFAPKYGIDEDPVTGSAFTQLTPYWSEVLQKKRLHAKQISKRGGEVHCIYSGERVHILGSAVKYLEGIIEV